MHTYVKIYPIKRLNTELEEIFESRIAVYDEWHDEYVDSYLDDQVYYWYSKDEFKELRLGQKMDEEIIYLVDIDFEGYHVEQIQLLEEELV